MRKLAFPVVALAAVFSVSAIGQQSPSPYLDAATVTTLGDAARSNNWPLFDALYAKGGDDAARFAELHAFWKWSISDPIGGFYSDDVHAKFTREYRDYAESIADYRIIDANGRAFYPSAETRRFLLQKAMDGTAPALRVAKATPKHRGAAHVSAPAKHVAKAVVLKHDAPPVVVPVPARKPIVIAAQKKVSAPQTLQTQQTEPIPAPPVSDGRLARGFALIIAGLLAVGTVTVILHAPKETI